MAESTYVYVARPRQGQLLLFFVSFKPLLIRTVEFRIAGLLMYAFVRRHADCLLLGPDRDLYIRLRLWALSVRIKPPVGNITLWPGNGLIRDTSLIKTISSSQNRMSSPTLAEQPSLLARIYGWFWGRKEQESKVTNLYFYIIYFVPQWFVFRAGYRRWRQWRYDSDCTYRYKTCSCSFDHDPSSFVVGPHTVHVLARPYDTKRLRTGKSSFWLADIW